MLIVCSIFIINNVFILFTIRVSCDKISPKTWQTGTGRLGPLLTTFLTFSLALQGKQIVLDIRYLSFNPLILLISNFTWISLHWHVQDSDLNTCKSLCRHVSLWAGSQSQWHVAWSTRSMVAHSLSHLPGPRPHLPSMTGTDLVLVELATHVLLLRPVSQPPPHRYTWEIIYFTIVMQGRYCLLVSKAGMKLPT